MSRKGVACDLTIERIAAAPSRLAPMARRSRAGRHAGLDRAFAPSTMRSVICRRAAVPSAAPWPRRRPWLRPDQTAPGPRIEAARATVWRAIQVVGGIGSPAGSCLWHVLGWQQSLKEWAIEQGWSGRRVSPEAASGILIAALGALESHHTR